MLISVPSQLPRTCLTLGTGIMTMPTTTQSGGSAQRAWGAAGTGSWLHTEPCASRDEPGNEEPQHVPNTILPAAL